MDYQKAIELIQKSGRFGLILPQETSVDTLVSAEVLSRVLKGEGKQTGLLSPLDIANEALRGACQKITEASSLPREFVISLNTGKAPIAELRYEKTDEALDILISPKSTPLDSSFVSFREGKLQCDCAILLGVSAIEALGDQMKLDPLFFTETSLINIDCQDQNQHYAEINLVDPQKSSLAEIVYELVTALREAPLGHEEATLLLAGIVERTDNFQSALISADALLTSSELMRLGAELTAARTFSAPIKPLGLVQLEGRAAVRSRLDEDGGVFWSFLTAEDYEKTGRSPQDIASVMQNLETKSPPQQTLVLLSQNPASKSIAAFISSKNEVLSAIRSREEAEFQSPYLKLAREFSSFKEAEELLRLLLREVL